MTHDDSRAPTEQFPAYQDPQAPPTNPNQFPADEVWHQQTRADQAYAQTQTSHAPPPMYPPVGGHAWPTPPQGMPQGPPPEKPRWRKYLKRALIGLAIFIGLLIVIAIIGAAVGGGKPAANSSPTSVPSTSSTPLISASSGQAAVPGTTPTATHHAQHKAHHVVAAAPTHAAPKPQATVIARFTGSGIENTPSFTVPDSWHLSWWYSCSSFGTSGNFVVSEYNTDGTMDVNGNVIVNELGMGGGPRASYVYGDAGTHYLQINSECNWSVAVVSG